jgi:cobalt-zinc-cadmium efflux system protein
VRPHARPQAELANSFHQYRNAHGAVAVTGTVPGGPVLLVDDVRGSGWTLTTVAGLLRERGAVEILAALVNGVVLCVMAVGILLATYQRIWQPPHVPGGPIVAVAVLGLAVNMAGLWLLHAGAGESLNVRSAYLEVLGDAVSSGVVIVTGVVILATGWVVVDPIAGAVIALFLLPRTWSLLRQAVNVLLEGAPAHLDVNEIEAALASSPSVRRVHDLHVWTLTSGREAMSAHVVVDPGAPSDKILEELHVVLHARFGIDHTTIQIETEPAPLIQINPKPG